MVQIVIVGVRSLLVYIFLKLSYFLHASASNLLAHVLELVALGSGTAIVGGWGRLGTVQRVIGDPR